MVATKSTMIDLGQKMPSFHLVDQISGDKVVSEKLNQSKGILIAFICNHCPYVIHIMPKLSEIITKYQTQGIQTFCINSNDTLNYPDDDPSKMPSFFETYHLKTPYLFDEDQSVALSFQASCTPDFFLFNSSRELVYRGQFCSSRPKNNTEVTGEDLENALKALVNKEDIGHDQIPSMGCNIKWKQENVPDYFKH